MALHDDIVAAQRIVSRADFNFGDKELFHTTSAVYKISNERTQDYYSYLIGREKVLSVIGSGDQILNLILIFCFELYVKAQTVPSFITHHKILYGSFEYAISIICLPSNKWLANNDNSCPSYEFE